MRMSACTKTMRLSDRLESNLSKYQRQFEEAVNDAQLRNIAFGSAGYLSKASRNRLYAQREKIGRLCDKIQLTQLSIRIVNGETFEFKDIQAIYNSFLSLRNPELGAEFMTECFRLCKVTEMINIIFEVYQVSYRKSILKYKLKYKNSSGAVLEIPLEISPAFSP